MSTTPRDQAGEGEEAVQCLREGIEPAAPTSKSDMSS
jgi:hypothetical protein